MYILYLKHQILSMCVCCQAAAAEQRSKDFKQGGGGEKLKAKAKALEDAERKNRENGPNQLKWQM